MEDVSSQQVVRGEEKKLVVTRGISDIDGGSTARELVQPGGEH